MSSATIRLGLLGFGEAAARLARDFTQAGFTNILGYSRSGARAQPGDPVHQRAQAAGVTLVRTVGTLAKKSDVILALTPGKSALAWRGLLSELDNIPQGGCKAALRFITSRCHHRLIKEGSGSWELLDGGDVFVFLWHTKQDGLNNSQ